MHKPENYDKYVKGSPDRYKPKYITIIETDAPVIDTLNACIEIAERVEQGRVRWTDSATLLAHLHVLKDDLELSKNAQKNITNFVVIAEAAERYLDAMNTFVSRPSEYVETVVTQAHKDLVSALALVGND